MASSTVRMSCSRDTCFSALSCRRAPTKSRLMSSALLSDRLRAKPSRRKKTWGSPTSQAAISVRGSIHASGRAAKWAPPEVGPAGLEPGSGHLEREARLDRIHAVRGGAGRRAVSPFHVVLEDADELFHESV